MNKSGHIKDQVSDNNGFRQFVVNCLGDNDGRKYFSISPFGIDFNAPVNTRALTSDSMNKDVKYNLGVLNKIKVEDLSPGESAIFSTNEDGTELKSFIKFRNDGTMEQNGNEDTLAGFTELKAGFDQGIQDLNDTRAELNKITAALTNWVPAPQDGGAALKTAYGSDPSVELPDSETNIDESEKENLKIE